MPRKKKSQHGTGLGSTLKNVVIGNKLISKGLGMIDHPIAQAGSYLANQLGLGKKKRKSKQHGGHKVFGQVGPEYTYGNGIVPFVGMGRHKQHGRGIFSDIGGGVAGIGTGVGNAAYGIGQGIGGAAYGIGKGVGGLFGGGKKHHGRHIKM